MIVAKLANNSTVYIEITEENNGGYFCEVYFDSTKKDYVDCFSIPSNKAKNKAEAIKMAIIRAKMIGK